MREARRRRGTDGSLCRWPRCRTASLNAFSATSAPLTIDVLRVTDAAITEIVTFHDDQFPRLGLPERLPADDPE
jgi:hypothetical protein